MNDIVKKKISKPILRMNDIVKKKISKPILRMNDIVKKPSIKFLTIPPISKILILYTLKRVYNFNYF